MSSPKKHYSFADVYASTLSKIQDRRNLDALREKDEFLYLQKMYNYMIDGISEYTNPTSIYPILSDRIDAQYLYKEYKMETSQNVLLLDDDMLLDSMSLLRFSINGEFVKYKYNTIDNTVTILDEVPQSNYILLCEKYIIGQFNKGLTDRQLSILSAHTAYIWALQVSNNEEDITRLLLDTDFHMASEASVTRAKTEWVNSYREKANVLMNSNDWGDMFLNSGVDNRPPTKY